MQFMYQYPETNGSERDLLDAGSVHEVAGTAEAAGWMGFAFTEHPVPAARWLETGGHQTLDPFVALGYAAAVTTRIRLLTYLAVVPYRNPFLLAKAAATVDKLSGGRFVLGVGTGYQKSEFHALGVDFAERNALFDEAIEVLPLHWKGEPFSYKGIHFDARDVIARPKPVQNPIPIWIGGNAKMTLKRIAERAQGWMPLLGPADLNVTARTPALGGLGELAATIAELRETASSRGEPIDVLYPYIDPSINSPEKDVERHREAFAELEKAGVNWVMVPGATDAPGPTLEFLQTFGATYLTR
jgi:probable F420-dependent oxidoreductase